MIENLLKIVYFDNDSAKDVSMLKNGGVVNIKETNQNILSDEKKEKISKKINFINIVFFLSYIFLFFYLTKKIEISLFSILLYPYLKKEIFNPIILEINQMLGITMDFEYNKLNKNEKNKETEISNTILTDFIKEHDSDIEEFEKINLKLEQNSMSFLTFYSSIFKILKPSALDSEDNPLDINKMEDFLNTYKGYYEAIAINKKKNEEYVFRFNRNAFRNQYDLSDLLKMDLKYFGILVGEMDKKDLDVSKMFDTFDQEVTSSNIHKIASNEEEPLLKIYDIILAGVIKK